MSAFGSGPSNGQFWYGSQTNFPGFLYKKNVGVGGRRSTKMGPGGNVTCNSATDLYNKYKPGTGGVGASSISNRRAKNRLATICGSSNKCFPCYNTLGQYSNYTHNPNGFVPCPGTINIISSNGSVTPTPSGTYTFTYLGNRNTDGTAPLDSNRYVTPTPSGTYTVTYLGNTNTSGIAPLDSNSTYNSGTSVTIFGNTGGLVKITGTPPNLLNTYQFGGWNTEADGSGTNYVGGNILTITQNTTLYAQWLPPISGVSLVYNFGTGGSGTPPPSSGTFYPAYSTQPVLDNTGFFTSSGYTFAGWNTAIGGTGTSYPFGSNITMVPNSSFLPITLYAQWSPDVTSNVNLTYAVGTGGIGTNIVTPYNLNTAVPIPGNQGFTNSHPNKIFYGWNTAIGGTGISYPIGSNITMNVSKTLYAQWGSPPSFTVTYDGNGATGLVPALPTSYPTGVQVPILGEGSLTNPGYTFLGWNSDKNGNGSLYAPGYTFTSKTVTLFAQWAPGSTIKSCAPTETYTTDPFTWYDIPYAQVIASTNTITIYLAAYFGTVQSNIGSGAGPYGIMSFVSKTVITSTNIINNTYTTYLNSANNYNYSQTITNGSDVTYWPSGASISSITFPSINSTSPFLYSQPATFNIETRRLSNGCGIGAYNSFFSGNSDTQFYFFNQGVTLNYSNGTNTKFVNCPVSSLYTVNRLANPITWSAMPLSNYPYGGLTTTTDNILTSITVIPSSGSVYINPPMPNYTVQYDPNGATGPTNFSPTSIPAPQYISPYTGTTSITIASQGTMVKTGSTFNGWNTAPNGSGTNYAVGSTYNGGASLILYAQWTP